MDPDSFHAEFQERVASEVMRVVKIRGAMVERLCQLALHHTPPSRWHTLRLAVNEPPLPERGQPQDLAAIAASPFPGVYCSLWPLGARPLVT